MLWGMTIFSTAALYWIYDGYGRCLQLLSLMCRIAGDRALIPTEILESGLPTVTVLLTVHNEDRAIRSRLENRPAPSPFRYFDWGMMATIGRAAAVVDLRWTRFSGWFAWLA